MKGAGLFIMKVMIMTKEYPPYIYGGAGVHVEYLSKELSELMKVEVRCFGGQREEEENLQVKGYKNPPWSFDVMDFDKVLVPMSINLSMVREPMDSSVVHCHTWYTFFAGFLTKTLRNIPLVTTIHSLEPLRPWKQEQLGTGYELTSWIERLGIEASDKVIAVSNGMKEDILKYYNVPEEKVQVIYNGIDLDIYKRVESKETLYEYGITEPYILFVGRISRQKGITVLLDAIRYLPKDVKVLLCAASPDTKELEEKIQERVLGMENIIWIKKMLPKEKVIELYSHAHIFVCPSLYEPFGIINLEAMACETPVVATEVGGIKEVVVNESTGLLVEPDNPRILADAINQLLTDESLRKSLGENGRRRVEEYFSWKMIAKQTYDLYNRFFE